MSAALTKRVVYTQFELPELGVIKYWTRARLQKKKKICYFKKKLVYANRPKALKKDVTLALRMTA